MSSGLEALTSSQPGERGGLESAVAAAFRFHQLRDDNMLPAKVISYDRTNNIAVVQPMIVWLAMDGTQVPRQQLANIPVMSLGAGGFHINFPVAAGSLGWIVASDRDLALFKQSLSQSEPNSARAHKFDDGMFMPDVFYKYVINEEDEGAMVIQSVDSETRISIREDNIKITAPTKVVVDTPLTEFTKNVQIDGNLIVTLLATMNGGFNALSDNGQLCTLPETTTINGINVLGHGHDQTGNEAGQRTEAGMIA